MSSPVPALTSVASVASSAVGMFSSTELFSVAISMKQTNLKIFLTTVIELFKIART